MALASLTRRTTAHDYVPTYLVNAMLPAEYRDALMSWPDYLNLITNFSFQGINYVVPSGTVREMTAQQGKQNPIVFACMALRAAVFAEIRLQFQSFASGRPSKLFGTPALQLVEKPWPTGTCREFLSRMEWDVSLAGNSYWVRDLNNLVRLDPFKTHILTGDVLGDTNRPYGTTLLGYAVSDASNQDVQVFLPDEVIHHKPIPDPDHPFRGQSWLSTIVTEISSDIDMTTYKKSFLNNGATPNIVVTMPMGASKEDMEKFRDKMEAFHTSPTNAFKTLYVGNGADVKAIGANFADMSFAAVQSQGETRIAAAAGCPPALLGIAEGLKGSTLNSGNFVNVARAFADRAMRPLWGAGCGAMETLVPPPNGARLWYSEREVPFLQQDETDASSIRMNDSSTMLNLVNSGYEPDSVMQAVTSGDFTLLTHTGLFSVQLQPPGTGDPATAVLVPVGGGKATPALPAAPPDDGDDPADG